ncbi:MAG: pentapeptide repeat-containing protein, partial [Pseudomonadota bacterium]
LPWLGRNYVWFVIAAAAGVLVLAYFGEGIAVDLYRAVARTAERLATESLTPEAFWRYALSLGALLAALAAAAAIPFQLIKTWLNERATSASEQAAITQRITEAVQMLGATREEKVRRRLTAWYEKDRAEDPAGDFSIRYVYEYEGRPPPLPEWYARLPHIETETQPLVDGGPPRPPDDVFDRLVEKHGDGWTTQPYAEAEDSRPNLEVRLGALFALERLSHDSRRDHIALMETICAYIRENFPAADAPGLGLPDWPEPLPDDASPEDREARAEHLRRRAGFFSQARRRADSLPEPRTDLQTALAVLGRRAARRRWLERRARLPYALDLRAASLQRADLRGLNLAHALLTEARIGGANLFQARMEGADLRRARMEGADLSRARMEGADLRGAVFDDALMWYAAATSARIRSTWTRRRSPAPSRPPSATARSPSRTA